MYYGLKKNVNTNVAKRAQLAMEFEGHALDWFMGYLAQNDDPTIIDINKYLKKKFRKPKSYSECVTELKEIR